MGKIKDEVMRTVEERVRERQESEQRAEEKLRDFLTLIGRSYDDLVELRELGLRSRATNEELTIKFLMPYDEYGNRSFLGMSVRVGKEFCEIRPSDEDGFVRASGKLASLVIDKNTDNTQYHRLSPSQVEKALMTWLSNQDLMIGAAPESEPVGSESEPAARGGDDHTAAGISELPGAAEQGHNA